MSRKVVRMRTGNDDLLFGQPNDLKEAVEALIAFYGREEIKNLLDANSHPYVDRGHYHIAEFIKDNWFLWWREHHGNHLLPLSKPPLVAYFHQLGIVHPDDMSSILLSAVWYELHHQPFDLQANIILLQQYWKEQGFPDGKPDVNRT